MDARFWPGRLAPLGQTAAGVRKSSSAATPGQRDYTNDRRNRREAEVRARHDADQRRAAAEDQPRRVARPNFPRETRPPTARRAGANARSLSRSLPPRRRRSPRRAGARRAGDRAQRRRAQLRARPRAPASRTRKRSRTTRRTSKRCSASSPTRQAAQSRPWPTSFAGLDLLATAVVALDDEFVVRYANPGRREPAHHRRAQPDRAAVPRLLRRARGSGARARGGARIHWDYSARRTSPTSAPDASRSLSRAP